MNDVINHYDLLIDENNDPVRDPEPLKAYMDKWDGKEFIDNMELKGDEDVLEIGVGTGRLAEKVAPLCKAFTGIDISPKTILRAKENLFCYNNINLICDDFRRFEFGKKYDVVYSSLTFMHIEDKQMAVFKIASLLKKDGKFILSIDKNDSDEIDVGTRKIAIYPDNPYHISYCISKAGLILLNQFETEFAHIFVSQLK